MANLTVTNGLLFCRELYVDSDTVDPALTGTQLVRIANEKYLKWHEKVERRFQIVTGTASGLSYTTGAPPARTGLYVATASLVNIAEIAEAYWSETGTDTVGVPMERGRLSEILTGLSDSAYSGAGASYVSGNDKFRWAAERAQTDTEADIGKWRVYIYPTAYTDGTTTFFVHLRARLVPALLTVSGETSTDQMDVSDEAAYTIWRMVAAEAARIVGDDEMVPGILAPIPQDTLVAMGMAELATRPRDTSAKRVA